VSDSSKLTSSHLRRQAFVYARQSSQAQVDHNVESTALQYALVERAIELGFTREQVVVIDDDLGISADGTVDREGFGRLAAEVALGHAGLVLGTNVSRVSRNNADWYRLLDLCGVTDTVIGDLDGLYHPGSFNDRLLLGLKGTISEAELHMIRQRLDSGIRNKAKRGELRRGLPVSCGARETVTCCLISTRLYTARSKRSSIVSRSLAPRVRCGCGCAEKVCSFRCGAFRALRSRG